MPARRSRLAALVALMLLAAGCGGAPAAPPAAPAAPAGQTAPAPAPAKPAAALETVNIQMPWVPAPNEVPFFLAVGRGYYKELGLDVHLIDGKGSGMAAEVVGAGQGANIGYTDLSFVALARAKGVPIEAIAGMIPTTTMAVFVGANSGIQSLKELPGHTFLEVPGSPETFLLPAAAKLVGFDLSKVKTVNGAANTREATFIAGKVDATAGDYAQGLAHYKGKRAFRAFRFSEAGLPVPGWGLFANTAYMQAHPDTVRKVVAATLRAWSDMKDPSLAKEAVDYEVKLNSAIAADAPVIVDGWQYYVPLIGTDPTVAGHPLGWMSPDGWAKGLQILHDFAGLQGSVDPKDYITNDYLPKS